MNTATGKTCPAALAALEKTVGPLAWNAKWEPPVDQDDIGKAVAHIHKAMKLLKRVSDRQAARKKLVECGECLKKYEAQHMNGGLCQDCDREECPTCEGTGMDPEPDYDDEEMNSDCPDCGGDGVV